MASFHIKGTAFLCFTSDNTRIYGFLAGNEGSALQVHGKICSTPETNYHECCFDTVPVFYELTITDTAKIDLDKELVIKPIMRLGGDNCSLVCDDKLEFSTDQLLDGPKAEEYIDKYFPKSLLNRDCYVCIGQMTINCVDTNG